MSAVATCPSCGEAIELTLDLGALEPPATPDPVVLRLGAEVRDCRLPRPSDVEAAADPLDVVAACLGVSRDEAARWLDVAEEAWAAADPLGAITIVGSCPNCRGTLAAEHDLVASWLTRLRRGADSLLREVHALAWSYGWSEDEILRLPAPRRQAYIDLCLGMALDVGGEFA